MISLEPEAAAMYCRILPVEKFVSGGGGNLGVFKPGSKYMVADLGGKLDSRKSEINGRKLVLKSLMTFLICI